MRETWWLAGERRAALEARGPLDVAGWMHVPHEILSTDRQSAAVCVAGEPPLLVKWRVPIAGRRRRTFLRPSRERREALAMLAAAARGIPCPAPWAVGERRRAGVVVGAVYIRAFDDAARTAEAAVAEEASRLDEVARALRQWHDLGFRHGDCYLKNILVGGATDAPRPIGCPAAHWVEAGTTLDERRLKDLAQFVVGIPPTIQPEEGARALRAYVEAAGLPPIARLFPLVQPYIDRIMVKKAKRIATRAQREPDGPPVPVPLDRGSRAPARIVVRALETRDP